MAAVGMGSAILSKAVSNYSSVSAAVAELWFRRPLTRLTPDLVHIPICSDGGPGAWKQVPVHNGTKVHFHRLPVLDANVTALTEQADDPDPVAGSLIAVTAEVATYGDFMLIGDVAEDASLNGALPLAAEMMGQRAMRSFDSLIYDTIVAGGTTACFQDGVPLLDLSAVSAEANHGLTMANLRQLAYTFKGNNVRVYQTGEAAGAYRYNAHPRTIKTIRAQTGTNEYVDFAKNAGMKDVIGSMYVGRLEGFAFFETTDIDLIASHTSAGATPTASAYENIACGYESVGAVSLGGNAASVPKRGTGRLINRPHHQYRTNFSLIHKSHKEGGPQNPLERRATVGYKFRTAIRVLDANRAYVHLVFGHSVS